MDDFSRYILGWEPKKGMTASSLIDAVQQAVDFTGMSEVPVKDRTSLLSDNGSGYVSQAFSDYLRLVGIKHSLALEYRQSLDSFIDEIADVDRRLERLYDALETGKIQLVDLAPRIQQLRQRQGQLQLARLETEHQLSDRRVELADAETVARCVSD
ncbi:unnamed protein product, partial [marine sediment metagenome]